MWRVVYYCLPCDNISQSCSQHMAKQVDGLDLDFLLKCRNILLIRDPVAMLASVWTHLAVLPLPSLTPPPSPALRPATPPSSFLLSCRRLTTHSTHLYATSGATSWKRTVSGKRASLPSSNCSPTFVPRSHLRTSLSAYWTSCASLSFHL